VSTLTYNCNNYRLRKCLNNQASAPIRLQIAKILASTRQFGEAVEQLQHAISLFGSEGADTSVAVQEMERIEEMMRSDGLEDTNEVGGMLSYEENAAGYSEHDEDYSLEEVP
jgi:hypothetical protein